MSGHNVETTAPVLVRTATREDLDRVQAIYAHHVLHGLASFEEVPPDLAEVTRRYEAVQALGMPYIVAEIAGTVVGYAYCGTYRARPAYRYTVENSVYLDHGLARRGIGRMLLAELIARTEKTPARVMVAIIGDSDHQASIRLHQSLGFKMVGVLEGVGFKFGRWVDSVLMQRTLGPGQTTPPDP